MFQIIIDLSHFYRLILILIFYDFIDFWDFNRFNFFSHEFLIFPPEKFYCSALVVAKVAFIINNFCWHWWGSSLPGLRIAKSENLSAQMSGGKFCWKHFGRSVFKTRFAMNQPCLQNKICFQCEGWPSALSTKKQTFKTRFAMNLNQPCLQNKICFQWEGWTSALNTKNFAWAPK